MKPTTKAGESQPSQPRDPCGCCHSSNLAFPGFGFLRDADATVRASVDDDSRSSIEWSPSSRKASLGEIDAPDRPPRNQRNEPNVNIGKICRLSGLSPRCTTAGAKRRNKPIVNLDRLYRLCGRDVERPLLQARRRNKPNCGSRPILRIGRDLGIPGMARSSCRHPGFRRTGWVLACIAGHREAGRGFISDSQVVERSIETELGGARSGRVEKCETNPTAHFLVANF
jgi:hypothetical protein